MNRILVALNASPHSQAALDAAVRLARNFEAELRGLFVQDKRLLRAAQLPIAEEVRAFTSAPKRLDDRRMKRQLRYQAEFAEWSLQQKAEEAEIPYDFQVVEDDVTHALLEAAPDIDLLVLGKTSTASSRRRLGTTSRRILTDAPTNVLVLRDAMAGEASVLTYYDGSPAAETALELSVTLANQAHSRLTVLLPPKTDIDAEHLAADLRAKRSEPNAFVDVRTVPRVETLRLSGFARRKGGPVIFPAQCAPLQAGSIQEFLYEIDRPLLLVRKPTAEKKETLVSSAA